MRHAGGWLALAALTVFPFSVDNFELPHLVVLALGATVLSYVGAQATISRTLGWCLALVASAALVTTIASRSAAFSTPGLISLLIISAFALVSAGLSWRPVLWTTWPIAAWALAQGLGFDPVIWSEASRWCGGVRPFSTLGHPTQLGVWMALVCVLAVDDAVTRKSWPMGLTALLAGVTCGVTLSRAGWLALGVGLGCWWWARRKDLPRLSSRGMAAIVGAMLIVLGVAKGPALLERVTNFLVAPTRVQLWSTALAGFRQHPWLGWGFDTFALVDQELRSPDAWRYEWGGTAGHAHSLFPQTLATEGLLGLAALLVAAVLVLREWKATPPDAASRAVVLAIAAASMVTFSGAAVAALGVCALAQSLRGPRITRSSWLPLPLVMLCALAVMLLGASVAARVDPSQSTARRLEPWNGQWPALQGEVFERAGRMDEALAAYTRAAELAPLAVFEANVGRVASKQGDATRARAAFDRARRRAPLDARIALDAAEASLRAEEFGLAEATLTSLLGLYPSDGPAWLLLARLRLRTNRVVEARAALEVSLEADWRDWPEGMGVARSVLTELLQRTGDPQRAAQLAQGPQVFAVPGDACGAPSLLRSLR